MVDSMLTPGQMNVAEKANGRISRLRQAEIRAVFDAEFTEIENKYGKKYKINQIKAQIRVAERKLRDLQDKLKEAKERANENAKTELARINRKKAEALKGETLRTTIASMTVLAHSLPPDLRDALAIDDTKKMLADPKKAVNTK